MEQSTSITKVPQFLAAKGLHMTAVQRANVTIRQALGTYVYHWSIATPNEPGSD